MWTPISDGSSAVSDGPLRPTRTRSRSRSARSFRLKTGLSCAITSSGMAAGAVMPATRRAALARSLAGARRTAKERLIRSRLPSSFGSRGDDEGASPILRPAEVENSALVGNLATYRGGRWRRKLRIGRKFDIECGTVVESSALIGNLVAVAWHRRRRAHVLLAGCVESPLLTEPTAPVESPTRLFRLRSQQQILRQ